MNDNRLEPDVSPEEQARFDAWLARELPRLDEPPPTPRADLWRRVEAVRTRVPASGIRRQTSWLAWGAGIAAVLALGFGLGRLSQPMDAPAALPIATEPATDPARRQIAYELVASQHLSRVEALLTDLRSEPVGQTYSGAARDLLITTRLLLDSRGLDDARTRQLLEDLEFILAQVVQLGATQRPDDLDLITDGLEQRQVLPRLRTAIPAGPARS